MRVQDIMRKDYPALHADDKLERIIELFSDRRVTSAPVFDKDEFVGIVSHTDIAKYFAPREQLLPFLDSQPAAEGMAIASSLAKKPPFTLTPDQPLQLVAGRISSSADCVPVMQNGRVVGVVASEDLFGFYLAEIVKREASGQKPKITAKKGHTEEDNSTSIDKILGIVGREREATPKEVARELGISEKTVEDLSRLLAKHHLLEISYSFLSGMKMRRIEHGKN